MAHERKRHLLGPLAGLAKMSPLVGILGHRQVGKTTLLEQISSNYFSLDDEDCLQRVIESPKKFLESCKVLGTAIDESQLCEGLFPALKERVRINKKPGQFYLSGSVRFTSKKAIRESLTGRIMNLELLPFTLSELDKKALPDTLVNIIGSPRFSASDLQTVSRTEMARRKKIVDLYLERGGLPGVCFIKDQSLREKKVVDQLETIINRDVRQIYNTSLTYREILGFVRELAKRDGEPLNHSELKRATGISPLTQKKLLFALEATFVIRIILIEGDFKGYSVVFEDQAEANVLSAHSISANHQWSGFVYRNIREQFFYRSEANADFFQYRTKAGVLVPVCVRDKSGILGILPIQPAPSRATVAAAYSFLRKYSNSKILIVTENEPPSVMDDRIGITNAASLLF